LGVSNTGEMSSGRIPVDFYYQLWFLSKDWLQ